MSGSNKRGGLIHRRMIGSSSTATLILLAGFNGTSAFAAELPVPCIAGSCGPSVSNWVSSGAATATSGNNTLTINQTTPTAVLNWQKFDISADGKVEFKQPDAASVALNRIFQNSPTKILGALSANGTVYLVNQNGILFGAGAQVNVGGLVASTLDVTPQAINGLLNAAPTGAAALAAFKDADGKVLSGDIKVEHDAKLNATSGQMLLAGTNVTNEGTITAADGQVILAAGDSVYLVAADTNSDLRGLLVEVGKGGTVNNAAGGTVSADRGNVTLVGLMVNQSGRVSATTSVRQNGSIRLLARDGGSATPGTGNLTVSNGGTLTLGENSVTDIALELTSTEQAVDATAQARSSVSLEGRNVTLAAGSRVIANAGKVSVIARSNPGVAPADFAPTPGDGRLVIEKNAIIDVSGATIDKTMESNVLKVELRGSQLADSALQRDGALRGKTVYVDIRQNGTRADGTAWQGSPIGDLAGDISTIQKTVGERSLMGGTISLASDGAALIHQNSVLDVSGGAIRFQDGFINTSQLIGMDGRAYDIANADPGRFYAGIGSGVSVTHEKWGVTETFLTYYADPRGHFEKGYVEGKDAGLVSFLSPIVALEGTVKANVSVGDHQRKMPTVVPEGVYRPFDQVPLAGTLTLGSATPTTLGNLNNYVLGDVAFSSENILDTLRNALGEPFDPLKDPLPDELKQARLNSGLLGPNGVGNLEIYSNGRISLARDAAIALPAGGSLALTAGQIELDGRITAPSGSISATSTFTATTLPSVSDAYLRVGSGSTLDVSGRWINDASTPGDAPTHEALPLNGGSVSLSAGTGTLLELQKGGLVDASAGAQRTAAGAIRAGAGGSISISAAPSADAAALPSVVESTFQAFGLADGGGLSITASSICIAATDCTEGKDGAYWADPNRLVDGGFSQLTFASNLGGVDVAPGSIIRPRQVNLEFDRDASMLASGASLTSITHRTVLLDQQRKPVNLTLSARPRALEAFVAERYAEAGILEVGAGAVIDLDPLAKLNLTSSSSIVVNGVLSAPGGDITLRITPDLSIDGFLPQQGLWLGDSARLLAAGAPQLTTNDRGLLTGTVLNGGRITLEADRGYIVASGKSLVDVSGSFATLNASADATFGTAPLMNVASAGGSITLAAAEGMFLNGSLRANAGGAKAAGGSLSVRLDGNLRGNEPRETGPPILPTNAREIRVGDVAAVAVGARGTVPMQYNGVALLSENLLNDGGFSSIKLDARNLFDTLNPAGASVPMSTGSIRFVGDTTLSTAASLTLNAPRISAAPGASVQLASSYVSLGNENSSNGTQDGATTSLGTATLTVRADMIDLVGNLGLDGFGTTELRSAGDIRLRGVQLPGVSEKRPIEGKLIASGSLLLEAQQIYPTTMNQFGIEVIEKPAVVDANDPDKILEPAVPGKVRIASVAGTAGAVLSAGGSLTIEAAEIEQAGVLRAPFGTITLDAGANGKLTLAANSLTSTSGAGLLVPFGTVQSGLDWTYQMPLGQTTVLTSDGPPSQKVALNGGDVNVQSGATVDLSGGGDLQAYEYIPGVNGTRDVLANDFYAGQFAVVPSLSTPFAAYDPSEQSNFNYAPGDSVYLSGMAGLPAGQYAILPARYALLPGAFLVRPVSGYTDTQLGSSFTQADGSTVLPGYRTQAGTSIQDSRTSGFQIVSGAVLAKQARYDLSKANAFFTDAAQRLDIAPARLPNDSGQLQLTASQKLGFDGKLLAAGVNGGRGALVDISSAKLQLVSGENADVLPDFVAVDVAQFNSLGADSLLIGGLREQTAEGMLINRKGTDEFGAPVDTGASEVRVGAGVHLTGKDLILVARDKLAIDAGATLEAVGASSAEPAAIKVDGAGSLLRVSNGALAQVTRPDGVTGGELTLAAGSVLRSSGSALLDTSGNVVQQATFDLRNASLGFSVSSLSLGAAVDGTAGLVLQPAALSTLGLKELSLSSTSAIDIYGDVALDVTGDLRLQAPGVRAMTSDASARFSADSVMLKGLDTGDQTSITGTASSGSLAFDANRVGMNGGILSSVGFNSTNLTARNEVRLSDAGTLRTDGGMRIDTPLVTTANGVDFALAAANAMQIASTTSALDGTTPAGIGGRLDISGKSVDIATRVVLPAGIITAKADGTDAADGVTLSSGAALDVSGVERIFDSQHVTAPGGLVRLESVTGNVSTASGSTVNVSAATDGSKAGRLEVAATHGEVAFAGSLLGHGASGTAGGEIALDALRLPDMGLLNAALNNAGFTALRDFRQRGPGDLVVAADLASAVKASRVRLVNDNGSIIVDGSIIASGAQSGSVLLAAGNDVDIRGSVLADASETGANGGKIDLQSDRGGVFLRDGSLVSLSAGSGGTGGVLGVRASRDALLTVTDGDGTNDAVRLGTGIRGAGDVTVEGFARYTRTSIGAAEVAASAGNELFDDATSFMSHAGDLVSALDSSGGLGVRVVPGIEINSTDDLTLSQAWDLNAWRFGGEAGVLTLRAGRDLLIRNSLSDGFDTATSFMLPVTPGRSWSYRLVAGADASSSDVMSVNTTGSGKVRVAGATNTTKTAVRTGTGDISISAAGNLELGNTVSVIYTAGVRSADGIPLAKLPAAMQPYPENGGDIDINVGGSIIGAPSPQLVTDWLWRTGQRTGDNPTGWSVNFQRFEQGVGALAGGDVTIRAGGDIRDLSVNIATIGKQVGGTNAATSVVQVTGGGTMDVRSGGAITGGSYFVGEGSATITAGDRIGSNSAALPASILAPTLAVGDATFDLSARRDLVLEAATNPFLLPQSRVQPTVGNITFFTTYTDRSAVNLASTAGDITLTNDPALGLIRLLTSMQISSDAAKAFLAYPGSLNAVALSGDFTLGGQLGLWPSQNGQLNLFAQGSVNLGAAPITMSDIDPTSFMTILAPAAGLTDPATRLKYIDQYVLSEPLAGVAHTPIHSAEYRKDGAGDTSPVRIVAATGDVKSANLAYIPKALRMVAGRDILEPFVKIGHFDESDLSLFSAGRNISYAKERDPVSGALATNTRGIVVEGPGRVVLQAGGGIELGTSNGIATVGNTGNAFLPSRGADVSLLAGVSGGLPQLDAFIDRYIGKSSAYDASLLAYVRKHPGSSGVTTKAEALGALNSMSYDEKYAFAEGVMFSEVRAGGRTAAADGPKHNDYTQAFDAIETMFPGSTVPDEGAGPRNPYQGDVSLLFSKIYTQGGGDISISAPGGSVNVGLATPPTAFGISKAPSDLGIVAQKEGNVSSLSYRDYQVNESRTFAADGGNILVWSTQGDIDAGRGAKTAISAPPPIVKINASGQFETIFPAALTGSGIQALATSEGRKPGDVDLFAPRGVVNASDAGIVAGNLTIGATAVLGRDNIQVSGVSVGVPADSGGLGASLVGASSVASSASNAAEALATDNNRQESKTPLTESALGWLEVFIEGFGTDVCKAGDAACLQRQAPPN